MARETAAQILKARTDLLLLLLLLQFLLSGCSHVAMEPGYSGPLTRPEKLSAEFPHTKFSGKYHETISGEKLSHMVKKIRLTGSCGLFPGDGVIHATYYSPGGDVKSPVILLLPVMDGKNRFVRIFAEHFAADGFATVIVHRMKKWRKLGDIDAALRQALCAHRTVIDWIETRPELDAARIGVFGISMGGINGALLCGLDERIRASVIALAAGDLPYVITYSSEKRIRRIRERFMAGNELTEGGLYERLSQEIRCDPLRVAPYCDARSILMILAIFDRTVPFAKGLALRRRMGTPETVYLLSGHYTALLYIPYVKQISLDFFKGKLAQKAVHSSSTARKSK